MRFRCLVLLLLSFLSGSAQTPMPFRFQPAPAYHPPTYYSFRQQRLLLLLSSTEYHVARNAEISLDSSLLRAAQWVGLSRWAGIGEGCDRAVFSGDGWLDRREAGIAVRAL